MIAKYPMLYQVFLILVFFQINCYKLIGQSVNKQSNFDVLFYELDLHLNDTNTFVYGRTSILVQFTMNSENIILNMGDNLTVKEIKCGNNGNNWN